MGDAARNQGQYLRSFEPDLLLLQEANRNSIAELCDAANMDWYRCSLDYRVPMPDDGQARRRGCAIAGRGIAPGSGRIITDVPVPERTLVVELGNDKQAVTVGSFHAPPGVSWFEKKAIQAVKIAQWLARVRSPALFGIDANTPEIDHPDFGQTRTHWHTGRARLKGESGDDLLVGPDKMHALRDALRVWFDDHPEQFEALRSRYPTGPLAISHRRGENKNSPGTPMRYDSIWLSDHFTVQSIDYHYDDTPGALSDHAAVHAVITL